MTNIEKEKAKQNKILDIKRATTKGFIDSIFEEIDHTFLSDTIKDFVSFDIIPFSDFHLNLKVETNLLDNEEKKLKIQILADLIKTTSHITKSEKIEFIKSILTKFKLPYMTYSLSEEIIQAFIKESLNDFNISYSNFDFNSSNGWAGSFFSRRKIKRQSISFTINKIFGTDIKFSISLNKSQMTLPKCDMINVIDILKKLAEFNQEKVNQNKNDKELPECSKNFTLSITSQNGTNVEFLIEHKFLAKKIKQSDFDSAPLFVEEISKTLKVYLRYLNIPCNSISDLDIFVDKFFENPELLKIIDFNNLKGEEEIELIKKYLLHLPNVESVEIKPHNATNRVFISIKKDCIDYHFYPMKLYCLDDFIKNHKTDFFNDENFAQGFTDEKVPAKNGGSVDFIFVKGSSFKKNKTTIFVEDFYVASKTVKKKDIQQLLEKESCYYSLMDENQRESALRQDFISKATSSENILVRKKL